MFPQCVRANAGLKLEVCHVARILGVAERTVRWLVANGQLPNCRRGEKILVFDYEVVISLKQRRDLKGRSH